MNSLMNFDELSIEELQVMQERIVSIRMKKLEHELEETKSLIIKQSKELEIVREENKMNLELERARHRKAENRYGYISLSDLGNQFTVAIGSKTMGTLLRLVGIAKAKQSITEPMAESIRADYAKSQDTPWGGIIWQWNSERCIEKIDRWLKREEIIDQFYSFTDERELMAYIKHLEDTYN